MKGYRDHVALDTVLVVEAMLTYTFGYRCESDLPLLREPIEVAEFP